MRWRRICCGRLDEGGHSLALVATALVARRSSLRCSWIW